MKPEEICRNVDARIRPQAEILARQVFSMAEKLEEARKQMKYEQIVIEYDNGGGQTGVRENPYYAAYEKLLASYTKSLTTLRDILGEHAQSEMKVLDDLRSKFKVVV